ncbi:FtsX-like permease family protein [Microbacterium sp.]|uniref:FtsX-like permease family protein n=1 Tax=Microbacterium sp. TaxID=51671 RepID=UPI003A949B4A
MLFAVRRAAQHGGQLVVLGVVAAALSATLAGASAVIDRTVDDGVARVVADADPMDRTIVVDAPRDGTDVQAVDAAIRASFGSSAHAERTTWAEAPLDPVGAAGGTATGAATVAAPRSVVLVAVPDVARHALLVDGAWPTGGDGAISAPAADRLGVATGDTLTSGGASITLVGVWRADDPAAAIWAGDPSIASGLDGAAVGPVLVSDDVVDTVGQGARERWTISAAHPVTDASVGRLRAGITRLSAAVDEFNAGGLGMRISGGWDATLARAAGASGAARSILAIPVVLLIAVGALVLGVLARGIGRRLSDEIDLLRRRGAARAAVLGEIAGIAGAIGVVALAVGTVVGLAAGSSPAPALGAAAVSAAGAFVLITLVLTAAALTAPGARGDVTRQTVAGMAAAAVFAAVLAGLAAAQLLTTGLAPDGSADVAAAAAPALAIISAGLVGALVAGPVAAAGARVARGMRGLAAVLALRRLSRRAPVVLAGVLSLALAAGAILFAAVAVAGAGTAARTATGSIVGADVRAVYDTSPIVDASTPTLDARAVDAPGAHLHTAFVSPITSGQVTARLVAVPGSVLARDAHLEASTLAPGVALALGDTLAVEVTASPPEGLTAPADLRVTVRAWLADPSGAARAVTLGTVAPDRTQHRLSTTVEHGDRLAAVEVSAPGPQESDDGVTVYETTPGSSSPGVVEGGSAAPDTTSTDIGVQVVAHGDGAEASLGLALEAGRRVSRGVTVDDVDARAEVVVTRSFADALALSVGDNVSIGLGTLARPINARIAAVRELLPGIGSARGVAMDFTALTARALQLGGSVPAADQIWAQTSDVAGTAAALRASARTPVRIVTPASVGTAPVVDPMLVLVAVGVGVVAVLAVVGFAAVAIAGIRDRRDEVVPLRAFGFTPVQQRRTAAIELGVSAGLAVVVGAAAGIAIAVWLGPALVGALLAGAAA